MESLLSCSGMSVLCDNSLSMTGVHVSRGRISDAFLSHPNNAPEAHFAHFRATTREESTQTQNRLSHSTELHSQPNAALKTHTQAHLSSDRVGEFTTERLLRHSTQSTSRCRRSPCQTLAESSEPRSEERRVGKE